MLFPEQKGQTKDFGTAAFPREAKPDAFCI